jgi:hypothetical protein
VLSLLDVGAFSAWVLMAVCLVCIAILFIMRYEGTGYTLLGEHFAIVVDKNPLWSGNLDKVELKRLCNNVDYAYKKWR